MYNVGLARCKKTFTVFDLIRCSPPCRRHTCGNKTNEPWQFYMTTIQPRVRITLGRRTRRVFSDYRTGATAFAHTPNCSKCRNFGRLIPSVSISGLYYRLRISRPILRDCNNNTIACTGWFWDTAETCPSRCARVKGRKRRSVMQKTCRFFLLGYGPVSDFSLSKI